MSTKSNLGAVTAYAIAKKYGYTGTEREWATIQANAPNYYKDAKSKIEEDTATAKAVIETDKQNAKAEIQTKGEQTLASIPDDYTIFKNTFDSLGLVNVDGKLCVRMEN